MSEREKTAAALAVALLQCLASEDHNPHQVTVLSMQLDIDWGFAADKLVAELVARNEHHWAKLLSHFAGRFRILHSPAGPIDLFREFKELSPFASAGQDIFFLPPEEMAGICEETLHANGWCSDYDQFAFVIEQTNRGQHLRPIWIRPQPGSPAAELRDGPLVRPGENVNIVL